MSEKIEMIYDLVKTIDERQRIKSEKDIKRHATEHARMTNIEADVKELKSDDKDMSVRLYSLEKDKIFTTSFKSKAIKLVGFMAATVATIGGIYRIIG